MAQPTYIPFSPTGQLDTTNPISDRPPGTLITARDVATRWMGPRLGSLAIAQARNIGIANAAPRPVEDLYRFTGAVEYIEATMKTRQQYLLPRTWTVDCVFSPETVVGNGITQIFGWESGSGENNITIKRHTSSSGTPLLIEAAVGTTTSSTTLTSTSQTLVGSGAEGQHHVRLVRLRGELALFLNGALEDRATIPDDVHDGQQATWRIGDVAGSPRYTGLIHRVVVRQGAVLSGVEGYSDFMFPMNDDVRLCVYGGRQILGSDSVGVPGYLHRDYSRFGQHGQLTGTPTAIPATAEPPFRQAVQLVTSYTDQRGRRWNVFMIGGTLFWEEAA